MKKIVITKIIKKYNFNKDYNKYNEINNNVCNNVNNNNNGKYDSHKNEFEYVTTQRVKDAVIFEEDYFIFSSKFNKNLQMQKKVM